MALTFTVGAMFSILPGGRVLCSKCNAVTLHPNALPTCMVRCAGCGAEMLNLIHEGMHCDLHRMCLWGYSCREVCAKCTVEPKVPSLTHRRDGGVFYVFR